MCDIPKKWWNLFQPMISGDLGQNGLWFWGQLATSPITFDLKLKLCTITKASALSIKAHEVRENPKKETFYKILGRHVAMGEVWC